MTVLVTGGSGFLGSHIAEQLSQRGVAVRALVRRTSDTSFLRTLPGVELVDGGLDNVESLRHAVDGVTAIIHSAGLVKARGEAEFMSVNAGGTEKLLEAARANQNGLRRFVLVSSLTAMGPSNEQGAPVSPDAAPRPVTAYGRSKRAAECAALALRDDLPVTILRPSAIYGPRDREILAFFQAIRWGILPYMGSVKNKLTIIYGPDAARACVAAIDADVPSGSAYFLDDGEIYAFEDLFQAVEDALGKRAWLRVPLPRRLVETVARGSELYGKVRNQAVMLTPDKCQELFAQWVTDSSPAQAALGWKPLVKIAEGTHLTATWYRQHGWL
jgi:nucleoside-diphosphate-sugar epimerase